MGLSVLEASDNNVKVLLPLLDEAIPLASAILPPLVRSPWHPGRALVLGDDADIAIIADGVLPKRYLLFPPKFITVLAIVTDYLKPNFNLFSTSSSVSHSGFVLGTLNSTIGPSSLPFWSSLKVFFIFVRRSSLRNFCNGGKLVSWLA